jgi:hypothetical protein
MMAANHAQAADLLQNSAAYLQKQVPMQTWPVHKLANHARWLAD